MRRMLPRGVCERLPHVHHSEPDTAVLGLPQPFVELGHAGLRAIGAAEPDRPPTDQIADDDAIAVPLADGYLVDSDRLRRGRPGLGKLSAHVLHLQRLDCVPIEPEFVRNIFDRRLPAATADVESKAFRIERIIGEERQLLALHGATAPTIDAPDLHFEIDARVAAGEIANAPGSAIIPAAVCTTASAAKRFFVRRMSVTTRTRGSPNTPRTVVSARNPGKV